MRLDWQYDKIGDVLKTGAGGTPLKRHKEYYEGGDIPWLLSGEVGNRDIISTENFITQEGLNNSSAKLFPINTVLIAMYGATAGETGILRFDASTNQAVCGIYPNEKIIPEFLYYCMLIKKDELIAQATGNAQPNISQIKIKNTEIPIPPLPEQQRIVDILDEAFEAIDQAKANVERNIQNAEELFQSKLKFTFDEFYQNYKISTIGKEFNTSAGGTPKKSNKDYYNNGDVPWLRSGEVKQGDIFETEMFITEKGLSESSAKLFPENTVLIAMYGATAGDVGILKLEASTNQAVCGIFPNDDFTSEFIYYMIQYKREMLVKQAIGNAQPNLSQTKIKKLEIPLVPFIEQKEVISKISQFSDNVDELILGYNKQIESFEELKKSILQKAFSGELTGGESGLAGFRDEQDELVSKATEPEVEYDAGENGK